MKPLLAIAVHRTERSQDAACQSSQHRMPRRHLRVLPSLTRPNLFSGD